MIDDDTSTAVPGTGPKVVLLPSQKDDAAAAREAFKRNLPEAIETIVTIAKYRRAAFLVYKAEGFTDAQALELCTR